MTDITKCDGRIVTPDSATYCPHRESCWRFLAPEGHWQSWMSPPADMANCQAYWKRAADSRPISARDADALAEGHVKVAVAGLTQQVERMTAALEWYANALGNSKSMDYRIITQDGGKRARQALNRSEQ
jgi:hypothetical protein